MKIHKIKSILFLIVLISLIIINNLDELTLAFPQIYSENDDLKASDSELKLLWNKTWGDAGLRSLSIDSSDNLYATGGDRLYKIDPSGDFLWNFTLMGYSRSICLDPSENVYVSGLGYWLSKFSNNGTSIWNSTLSTPVTDLFQEIATDSNGDVYIWSLYNYEGDKYCLIKFDNQGNYLWNQTWRYPILQYYPHGANAIYIDHFDNIYVAASSRHLSTGNFAFHLYKFNTSGGLIWDTIWESSTLTFSDEFDIICDISGNIYASGGRYGMFLLRYNASGGLQMEVTLEPENWYETVAIELDESGNIYCGGTIKEWIDLQYNYDIGLLMFNNSGSYQCSYQWGSYSQNTMDFCDDLVLDNSYGLYLAGYSSDFDNHFTLLKFEIPAMFDVLKPNSDQVFGKISPSFEIQKLASNIDSTWYSLNHSGKYFFNGENGIINKTAWNSFGTGEIAIIFYANNTLGSIESEEIRLYKDLIEPNITIIDLIPNRLYGNFSPNFNILIDSPDLDEVWYTLDNGFNNYTVIGNSGTINQTAWDNWPNGTVVIKFYANDTVANIASESIQVYKDLSAPFIEINSPHAFKLYGKSLSYDLDFFGSNLDKMWYTLNEGGKNFFVSDIGTINGSIWEDCEDGLIHIEFFINDTESKETSTDIYVYQDTTSPEITILYPTEFQFFSDAPPTFNLTIIDENLNSTWHSLNGGFTNFTITGNSGIVDFDTWNSSLEGVIVVSFYANDSVSNFRSIEIILNKDTIQPNVSINTPIFNNRYVNQVPQYNVTISDINLSQKWYRINDGSANFFSSNTGFINSTQWDLCENDYVNITFYAIDLAGNIAYENVIIRKNITTREAYAIIIGISNYPGSTSDLNYCDDDALAVYDMLISDYNFRPENIIYLQDSTASKADIDNAFDTITSALEPDDIFFFYYSGHGGHGTYSTQGSWNVETLHPYWNNDDHIWSTPSVPGAMYMRIHFERFQTENYYDYALGGSVSVAQGYYHEEFTGDLGYNFWSSYIPVSRYYLRFISDSSTTAWGFEIDKYEAILEDGTHYLCSYDSIPSNPSAYYMDTLIDSKLDQIICGEKYVIVDACNSGGLIPEVQGIGRYIMTACLNTEESLETPLLEHGIFTNFLLEADKNANDQNSDGVISMEECYDYVYSHTLSYSSSFGSEYTHHPQEYDGISGEAVLKPAIGSVEINAINNTLDYSFYLYGHGNIKTLNLTYCTLEPSVNLVTEDIRFQNIDELSGFGFYSGTIKEFDGVTMGGIKLLVIIEGNQEITIEIFFGDFDGDGLTDIYEILHSGGLDPSTNDTDADGLNDYDEYYGDTDPINSDTDYDGLLDGEEVLVYLTNPLTNDTDSDNLSDYDEIHIYLTNPLIDDTDSDNLLDYDEIHIYLTNPIMNDTDSDNINDYDEVILYLSNPLSNDTDSDNLNDYDEIFNYLTNPLSNDTDSDNLNDYDEIFIYFTDPLNSDTDLDGLTDYEEIIIYGTNSTNSDTDSDTIPDGWEVLFSLDPFTNDTTLDHDNDLLLNLYEYQYNCDPFNNDTDNDALTDGDEVYTILTNPSVSDTDADWLLDGEEVIIYNTNPLDNDSDNDGLDDGEEVILYGTNPLYWDTDADELPDMWEIDYNLDPLVNDAELDNDEDGLTNYQEYQHNTNPNRPDTDNDGWDDGIEVDRGTDPLDPNDHPNPPSPGIPGYTFILIPTIIAVISLIYIKKKEIIRKFT